MSSSSDPDLPRSGSADSSCGRCTGRRDRPHRRGEQRLPPPIFHFQAPRKLPCHFTAAPGTKIVAVHPREAWGKPYAQLQPQPPLPCPFTVFDVRTRALSFGRQPDPNPVRSHEFPIYIPVGDGLLALCHASFHQLRPWPPPPGAGQCPAAAPALRVLPRLPFDAGFLATYAVHPDGRTVFVSTGGEWTDPATYSFRAPVEEEGFAGGWKPRGSWMLPCSGSLQGPAHFDRELNAWVGIRCDEEKDGYGHICAVDVVPADAGAGDGQPPARRLSKEQLLGEDPAESHTGATLLYMGSKSRFCLVECVCIEANEESNNVADRKQQFCTEMGNGSEVEEEDRETFLYRVTTFSLKLDKNGDLTTGNSRRIKYYSVPNGASHRFVQWNPVAFWM
ncbi:unnamed protein product [Urochloa decumbens]|uniref:Uncharacterized protein n=1 Tax=Urochloa decumbens TaxID=240449 RepID=A0ABC8YI21_9POAL